MSSSDVTTALSILPPLDSHNQLNFLRSKYDKAYPRWMPHINLLFPFVSEDKFDEVEKNLSEVLSTTTSFAIFLDHVNGFSQGKGNMTYHYAPSDDSNLQNLYKVVRKAIPDFKPQKDIFAAHMTVAQTTKQSESVVLEEIKKELGDGFGFPVDRIYILQRSKTDGKEPFHIAREIFLKE